MNHSFLRASTVPELLSTYSEIIDELRRRKVLRTANNPAADYAEFLSCRGLGLAPAENSEKGYDAFDPEGENYQIKARRIDTGSKPTRFSAIWKFEEGHFRYLIAVLFSHDFRVYRAFRLSRELVREKAFWQQHVNGWILPVADSIWNDPRVQDVTAALQRVQLENRG